MRSDDGGSDGGGRNACPLDLPGPVRSGEELDVAALRGFLARELPYLFADPTSPDETPLDVRQFGRGYSNLTYAIRVGREGTGREMVLRRPPFGSRVETAHDMSREYRVLSRLQPIWDKAPEPLAFYDDPDVLGAPFYLMERVRGVILRRDPPPGVELSPAVARRLSETFVDTLAELHGLDLEATGLAELGKPEGYVGRQVRGWTKRYHGSQTDDIPELERVADWLAERLPEVEPRSTAAFVHNDFKYDNLVLALDDPTRIRAVLDWEMSTVGDPLMDLGTTLGYWVEADDPEPLQRFRFGPTHLPGTLTRRELVERYGSGTGRQVPDLAFYYVFGLFKIAVIAQQIYYRWKQGLTRDERFGALIHAIRTLGHIAAEAAETGRL
jgi:aminoglycoside phosphotransferase (APT) family kinase protein